MKRQEKDYTIECAFSNDKLNIHCTGWPDFYDHKDVPEPNIFIQAIVDNENQRGVWLSEKQAFQLIKTIKKALVSASKHAMQVKIKTVEEND